MQYIAEYLINIYSEHETIIGNILDEFKNDLLTVLLLDFC